MSYWFKFHCYFMCFRVFFSFLNVLTGVLCRKLFASLGREELLETTVEASLVQHDKPSSGELLLHAHYRVGMKWVVNWIDLA